MIIDTYGFPGEKLIGLPPYFDDSLAYKKALLFYGPKVWDYRAYFMLLHYYSNPRNSLNEKLFPQITNGNLPATQYGAINDFMAKYSKKNHVYYNVWHYDPNDSNIPIINERRGAIGLNTFEEQEGNILLNRERRKNKSISDEIITE